jgi:hypothetical protein
MSTTGLSFDRCICANGAVADIPVHVGGPRRPAEASMPRHLGIAHRSPLNGPLRNPWKQSLLFIVVKDNVERFMHGLTSGKPNSTPRVDKTGVHAHRSCRAVEVDAPATRGVPRETSLQIAPTDH